MGTYPGGATIIYLKDCPADIQQKYNYNPTAADAAISEREKTVQATHKQLQRDQKIQLETWKKQQATNKPQEAAQSQQATQQQTAVPNSMPLVACLMSGGPQVVHCNMSTMRKIVSFLGSTRDKTGQIGGLVVVNQGGYGKELYYVDVPERRSQVLNFMSQNFKLSVSVKYVSCEFLYGLRGPETVYDY